MLSRRRFVLFSTAAVLARGAASLKPTERVDRALKGQDVDRSPFTYWHHFLDEAKPGEEHARSTLEFHRAFHTDVVKVMGDYPYPRPAGDWFDARVEPNPFPRQIRALELINKGLAGSAYFVDTLFNPYYVAEKLSSKEAVARLREDKPQRLLDLLEVIAKSEANHARRSVAAGSSGIFLAIQNSADHGYAKFSEPFDKMVLAAVSGARLNVLHIHGDKIDLPRFYKGWAATGINYSPHGTGIRLASVRASYGGVILAGLDEVKFKTLTAADIKRQHQEAVAAAGRKYILTPGCSVPNDSTDEELLRVTRYLGA